MKNEEFMTERDRAELAAAENNITEWRKAKKRVYNRIAARASRAKGVNL